VTQRFNARISPCGRRFERLFTGLSTAGVGPGRNSSSEAGVGLRVAEPPITPHASYQETPKWTPQSFPSELNKEATPLSMTIYLFL